MKHKGGRPRIEPSGARVTTWVRSPEYDRLLKLAQEHEQSVSSVVRDLLKLKLGRPEEV